MNKKLYFNLIFFITGSFIFLAMGSIVTVNFIKDSRIFGKQGIAVSSEVDSSQKSNQSSQSQGTNKEPETINYKREVVINRPKVDPGEDMLKYQPVEAFPPIATPTPIPVYVKNEDFTVEVINRTGASHVAETVRKSLESSGFKVSAGNGAGDKRVMTEIIDRNDKNAGREVKKVLRIGKLSKAVDSDSKYDVTVIIGDDYLP